MAGLNVPLVLLPRYTTYSGANGTVFTTIGMDITDYEKAVVSFWRSAGVSLTSITIDFQESMDQLNWTSCSGGAYTDPGAGTETQFSPVLTKRWFRISITINSSPNAVVTCWCIGFLIQREQ